MRWNAWARVALIVLLLLAEYAVIGVCFDGGDLARKGGWIAELANAGRVFTALIVVTTAGCLVHFRQLRRALSETTQSLAPFGWSWATLHFGAFGASLAAAFLLFGPVRSPAVQLLLVLAGGVAGTLSLASIVRATFGPSAADLVKVLLRAMVAGSALGLLAWGAGSALQPLWPRLARATLGGTAWLLEAFGARDIFVDNPSVRLAMGDFEVQIAEGCSGVEGMGLVAVFMSGYLYRFRAELRMTRALPLVPLAIGLAWLANVVRLAALVAIGAAGSPAIAVGGFHSKAGWVLFCAITLSLVLLVNRTPWFRRDAPPRVDEVAENPTAGYCMPFLALIAVSLVTGLLASSVDLLYPLRLVAALGALYWARGYLEELRPSPSWTALAYGITVFAAWLALTPVDSQAGTELERAVTGLSPMLRVGWLASRVLGSVAIVPIVEELAFRGFLQRRLVAYDFERLPYRQVTGWAVLGSAAAFGALHASWLLGTLAGVAYSLATLRRGRLGDAIFAHATTNLLLAVWALMHGRLELFY